MAVTRTTARNPDHAGIRTRIVGVYTGPSSYTNPGGDQITARSLGLARIEAVNGPLLASDANGANNRVLSVVYASDGSSVTFRWYTDLATEVANGVDLSSYLVRLEFVGV